MLTDHEGRKVIYKACDAEVPSISIRVKDDGTGFELIHGYGQDAGVFPIVNVLRQANGSLVFKLDGRDDYVLTYQDASHKVGTWVTGSISPNDFVQTEYKDEYPVVEQPLSDCGFDTPFQPEGPGPWRAEKRDESGQDPSLKAFVDGMKAAIARKDQAAILSMVHPNVEISLGTDNGVAAFKKLWFPAGKPSELWTLLNKLINLGGTFRRDSNGSPVNIFEFPYFQGKPIPGNADPYMAIFVTGADVNVRSAPSKSASVLGRLTYDVVTTQVRAPRPKEPGIPDQHPDQWTEVATLDQGLSGFVYNDYLWYYLGWRMVLGKENGKWMVSVLIQGD